MEEGNRPLTPREIVNRLDEYIIGQEAGKRAVAVAIRNRWRRQQLDPEMRQEVMPRNILMIGPTGVGKTEIARRLANLVEAPFVKVEASKYTEVGYHGRDVESMVRDLVKVSVVELHSREIEKMSAAAEKHVTERLLDRLLPGGRRRGKADDDPAPTREKLRKMLEKGELDDREIEIAAEAPATVGGVFGAFGGDDMEQEMQEMLSKILPGKKKARRVKVSDARRLFRQEEAEKLIDEDALNRRAVERAEQEGIIFIDEIDKIIGSDKENGPDVSREGVQRDLLPIVEGCTVATKYGPVKTDHILFIAAGAFHGKKPSDLIPELQGRLPIRVELESLKYEDFVRILTHPKNALTRQYELLLGTEGVKVEFRKDALEEIARITEKVNRSTDDIGARRLHTVMEKLFEEISFTAPEKNGSKIRVDAQMVRERLHSISEDEDLSRFIL